MEKLDAETRAKARRHTAEMLKMLRGKAPPPVVKPESPSSPVKTRQQEACAVQPEAHHQEMLQVAEAPATYFPEVVETPATDPPDLANKRNSTPQPLPAFTTDQKSPPAQVVRTIPTVGETLRQRSGRLGKLLDHVDEKSGFESVFRAYLPTYLHDHAVLVHLDEESWIVHTDSASWATRLRYTLPSIQQMLSQQIGFPLPKPQIRVKLRALSPPPRRPRPTLTPENARVLEEAACNEQHPHLKEALLRLAKRGYQKND